MAISTAFIPAVNKEGLSRLTFMGLTTLEGKAGDKSKKGEVYKEDWNITELAFEVMGRIRGDNKVIKVRVNEAYEVGKPLAIALTAMGYVPPVVETIEDEQGFEVESLPEDEQGFGVEVADTNAIAVTDFITASIGAVFTGKVYKEAEGKNTGRWTIGLESIKPFVAPTK